jgi:hypothetical protein
MLFFLWFSLCIILHLLIYICYNMPLSLKWNLLDHGI